ncbi:MAG TPA: carboxypeptidase-like regulatory domain-containing protein, partial [Longimicrobiales bacterium]|nr:carboxypeptidase-like regulatory domain-containing protein [Longimicrobiales bacterium]
MRRGRAPRSGARAGLRALLLVASLPAPGAAQSVLARVVTVEESEPIQGALAYLVDDASDRVVRTSLTDEVGRALFAGVPASTYRLRAEMIGREQAESAPFAVADGAAVARTLSLATRAIGLEGIEVTAETRRCTVRPGDDALAVAHVWDEARKALSAAALTDESGVYRYETVTYTRRLDARTRAIFDQEESRREAWAHRPFESRPAEDLVERGFVQREGRDWVFYAPDAGVLLSDVFLDTHCFRLAEGEPGLIGLAFEPTRDRDDATDIQGTLWLDAVNAELRWLEFGYWNLPDFPPS